MGLKKSAEVEGNMSKEALEDKIKELEGELAHYKQLHNFGESLFIGGEEYLSTRQLCERYKFLRLTTVRRWISQRKIHPHKLFGKNLIKVREFEKLLEESRV